MKNEFIRYLVLLLLTSFMCHHCLMYSKLLGVFGLDLLEGRKICNISKLFSTKDVWDMKVVVLSAYRGTVNSLLWI